ncbi:hypothetical protein [Streptomyces sp. NBC_01538]|uniref:hypothetical protein n=1 Tax=Streptomyces sp. NBC_01538 TaxID=2903897 RepID=UPI003870D05A
MIGKARIRRRGVDDRDDHADHDPETTDLPGQTVEIAAIDAATGQKLMNTLVKPTEPISDGAR